MIELRQGRDDDMEIEQDHQLIRVNVNHMREVLDKLQASLVREDLLKLTELEMEQLRQALSQVR
jgi:hypothetical protein